MRHRINSHQHNGKRSLKKMAELKVFKETALPGTLQANSVYLINPAGQSTYVEAYVTGTSASTVRRMIKESDIQAMIDTSIAGFSAVEVVSNIAARDALSLSDNAVVLVLDASADSTVNSGAATYIYRDASSSFQKIAEYESMDLTIDWSDIQNKPTSSVVDIDDAVTKKHTHTNKTQLDKVGEDGNGYFTYNSQNYVVVGSTSW